MRRTVCLLGTFTRPAVGYGVYGRTLQSVRDYIRAGDIPRLRYPQFEPRAPPDDSSDDDGGDYEDYEYAYYTPRQEYD